MKKKPFGEKNLLEEKTIGKKNQSEKKTIGKRKNLVKKNILKRKILLKKKKHIGKKKKHIEKKKTIEKKTFIVREPRPFCSVMQFHCVLSQGSDSCVDALTYRPIHKSSFHLLSFVSCTAYVFSSALSSAFIYNDTRVPWLKEKSPTCGHPHDSLSRGLCSVLSCFMVGTCIADPGIGW